MARLSSLAAALGELLACDAIDWTRRPAPGEWSLTEVACHLRDVEKEVHQTRFRQILAEPGAFLSGVSADEWAVERDYQTQDGPTALRAFLEAREETLSILSPLQGPGWELAGEHAFFGRTSLHELLFMVVRHDELHLRQIDELFVDKSAGN